MTPSLPRWLPRRRDALVLAGLAAVALALAAYTPSRFPSGTWHPARMARAVALALAATTAVLGTRALWRLPAAPRPEARDPIPAPWGWIDALLVAVLALSGVPHHRQGRLHGAMASDEASSMPRPDWDLLDVFVSDGGLPSAIHGVVRVLAMAIGSTHALEALHLVLWTAFVAAAWWTLRGFVPRALAAGVLVVFVTMPEYLHRTAEFRAYATFLPLAALASAAMAPGTRLRWPRADAVAFGAAALASLDNPLVSLLLGGVALGRMLEATAARDPDPSAEVLWRWTLRFAVVLVPVVAMALGYHGTAPPPSARVVGPGDIRYFLPSDRLVPFLLLVPMLPVGRRALPAVVAAGVTAAAWWTTVALEILPDEAKGFLPFLPLWFGVVLHPIAVAGRRWPPVAPILTALGLVALVLDALHTDGWPTWLVPALATVAGLGLVLAFVPTHPAARRVGQALLHAWGWALAAVLAHGLAPIWSSQLSETAARGPSARAMDAWIHAQPDPPPVHFDNLSVETTLATATRPELYARAVVVLPPEDLLLDPPYVPDGRVDCADPAPVWLVRERWPVSPPCGDCRLLHQTTPAQSGWRMEILDCRPIGAPPR